MKKAQAYSFQSPHSSNVAGARYSPSSKTLEVDFHKSGTYVYPMVPAEVWNGFQQAMSKGTYLATHIKPKYTGVRKEEPKKQPAVLDMAAQLKASIRRATDGK
jgi:hypothetical protein